ncbi:hypothetical protein ABEB36_008726 [Hypothenemus hampei]|uniref:G-protein coupled receptors family 1 profile domain-containing protein n=1 Tax=Hypothenemus hampei TaxID=57062 RepID=A0ABD1EMW0_HYPHA
MSVLICDTQFSKTFNCRKYNYLQKTCMISLAISDILTCVTFCFNYLDLLSKPLNLIWTLGEFFCWYNPVGQVLGNLASSLALFVIALDRYHNIMFALNRKWNPSLRNCLVVTILVWLLCFGISYPMATFYFHVPVILPDGTETIYICSANTKTRGDITFYYVSITILFFVPLIVMFFWFYFAIALLIWRHRKPIGQGANNGIDEASSSKSTSDNHQVVNTVHKKKKNVQMQRKVRTFKIVIVLIFAFIFCRMPYWLFWLVKLLTRFRNGDFVWRTTLILASLNLLNCVLNPILYTYLNQTLYLIRKIQNFICTTCCCCFSTAEFEDYEKGAPVHEGVLGKVAMVERDVVQQKPVFKAPHENFPQVPSFPKFTSVNRF